MTRWAADFLPALASSSIKLRDPDNGLFLLGDIDGIDMPPVELTEEELFDSQGSSLNNVRFGPREITVPIALFGPTQQQLRARARALVSAMNPRLGDGVMHLHPDDGSDGRILFCRYSKGLEGTMEVFEIGDGWWVAAPVFRGFDPYFYDPDETVVNFTQGTDAANTFFPMFADAADVGPHFGQSTTAHALTVTNAGDDVVYPRWIIQGPITNPILTNTSTGQAMDFSANGGLVLGAGDTMTIDPTVYPSAVDQNGHNLIPFLAAASVPWALGIGVNQISVSSVDIGAGALVQIAYRQRHLSA